MNLQKRLILKSLRLALREQSMPFLRKSRFWACRLQTKTIFQARDTNSPARQKSLKAMSRRTMPRLSHGLLQRAPFRSVAAIRTNSPWALLPNIQSTDLRETRLTATMFRAAHRAALPLPSPQIRHCSAWVRKRAARCVCPLRTAAFTA